MNALKWSNYIVKFEGENRIYLFKSISETLYALLPQEYSIIDRYLNGDKISLSNDIKIHISELYVDGLIVDARVDEVEVFKKSFRERMQSSDFGVLYFAPSFKCNLRCRYCIIGESISVPEDNFYPDMTGTNVIQTARWTYDMCIHYKISELKVILYGGEPMLSHKNNIAFIHSLNDMVKKDKNIQLKYMIITNGFRIKQEDIVELIGAGVQTAQVTLDGPPDIHDKRRYGVNREKTFNAILNNLLFMSTHFENTAIRINVDNENAKSINKLIDILYQNGLQKNVCYILIWSIHLIILMIVAIIMKQLQCLNLFIIMHFLKILILRRGDDTAHYHQSFILL